MDEGAVCVICSDDILSHSACALKCGHVYHCHCVQQWFENDKAGTCPQCKKPSGGADAIRVIVFEVAAIRPQSLQEVIQLEALSAQERDQLRAEAATEREEILEQVQRAELEVQEREQAAKAHKRVRKELERSFLADDVESKERKSKLSTKKYSIVQQRGQVDEGNNRQIKKLPTGKSRDPVQASDTDSREERRRLMSTRPYDRAKQLHDALLSAKQQETEANRAARESRIRADDMDKEVKQVREREVHLRRQLSERRIDAERKREAELPRDLSSKADTRLRTAVTGGQTSQEGLTHSSVVTSGAGEGPLRHLPENCAVGTPPGTPQATPPVVASTRSTASASGSLSSQGSAVASTGGSSVGTGEKRLFGAISSAQAKTIEQDDEADAVYGLTPAPRKGGGVGLLARSGIGATLPPKVATVTEVMTPARRNAGVKMNVLFSGRRGA